MRVETLQCSSGIPLFGPLLITPSVFSDNRGFFFESWNEHSFSNHLIESGQPSSDVNSLVFRQDNHSRSSRGVLRGLHYQLPPEPQGKLVRCTSGAVFDVAVDLRKRSSTYSQWVGVHLSAENYQQLWIPVGFAHGFLTLTDSADVQYKASGFWNRDCERSLRWDDPDVSIDWPFDLVGVSNPLLASKDAEAPFLSALDSSGEVFS